MADVERTEHAEIDISKSKLLKTLAQFIENCDKGEAERLSQYCNYLKTLIPRDIPYQDFYHWCLSMEEKPSSDGIDKENSN